MSSARHSIRLEPQEIAFAALYLVVLGRLVAAGRAGTMVAAIFFLLFAGAICSVWRCVTAPTAGRWAWRRWYFIATMPVAYWSLGPALAAFGTNHAAWLQAADHWLLGMSIETRLFPILHPWLTEILSVAYIGFFPLLAFGLLAHGRGASARTAAILRVFGTLYGLGFLGYTIVPAAGPYLEGTASAADLVSGLGATLNDFMVRQGSNRVDCFPSLHCALSGAVFYFEWRYARRRAWVAGLFALAIWLSTVYLRQHYFIDVLGGALLLTMVLLIVPRWPRDPSET